MRLLLKEDVEGLGFCGDEVTVKDGYGRNFLVPRGKAIAATPKNLKQFNHQKSIVQARVKKIVEAAKTLAAGIEKVTCTLKKKVGNHGKLFGAVTAQDIANALRKNDLEIDRRKIQLNEPIKALGQFKVPVKLHTEVTAKINVSVVQEQEKS
ncbi:MAG: 50S ribosomal protein L9 [Nitrospinota bacterium]|nr:50S ribosomal protein L9 [Nitrospinota bacterium]